MSQFRRPLKPPGISASTLHYLKLLELREKPADKTRVIATHFQEFSPGNASTSSVNPFSFNTNDNQIFEDESFSSNHRESDAKFEFTIPNLELTTAVFATSPSSTSSHDLFKSPLPKRKKLFEAFDASNLNFSNKTDVLFGEETAMSCQGNESEVGEVEEHSTAAGSLNMLESRMEISESIGDPTVFNIDESMVPRRCREGILEKSVIQNEKLHVSTVYTCRNLMKTSRQTIESYYERQKNIDWDQVADHMAEVMEPSLDYLQVKLNYAQNVTLGHNQPEVYEDDSFGCEAIRESVEEMEKSFDTPDFSFVASTPNRSKAHSSQDDSEILQVISFKKEPPATQEKSQSVFERAGGGMKGLRGGRSQTEATQETRNLFGNIQTAGRSEASQRMTESQPEASNNTTVSFNLFNFNIENLTDVNKSDDEPAFMGFTAEEQKADDFSNFRLVEPPEALLSTSPLHPTITDARRTAILTHIEQIMHSQLESLVQQKPLVLKIRQVKDWSDCEMQNDVLSQKEANVTTRCISFGRKTGERVYTIVVVVLCEIYKMLARNLTCTKRELFYRDVELFETQASVNKAIDTICTMLNVQQFELGVLSSSKGLIAGDLVINIGDERIDCRTTRAVPQNPSAITSLESAADYVLIVEKETVFQRLVSDGIFERITGKIVLVTAKGYPDVNTRLMLKRLATDLRIPMYIIVDADPHGVEIMCTYKFGSLMQIFNSEHLAVPSIEWIGIHPSDIENLDVPNVELTEADLKKVDELLERPYVNPLLRRELNCFKARRFKAEIENIYHYSIDYLINDYIPRKIRQVDTAQIPII